MFCSSCGAEIKDGARFCTKCGAEQKPLSSQGAPVQVNTPVQPYTPTGTRTGQKLADVANNVKGAAHGAASNEGNAYRPAVKSSSSAAGATSGSLNIMSIIALVVLIAAVVIGFAVPAVQVSGVGKGVGAVASTIYNATSALSGSSASVGSLEDSYSFFMLWGLGTGLAELLDAWGSDSNAAVMVFFALLSIISIIVFIIGAVLAAVGTIKGISLKGGKPASIVGFVLVAVAGLISTLDAFILAGQKLYGSTTLGSLGAGSVLILVLGIVGMALCIASKNKANQRA